MLGMIVAKRLILLEWNSSWTIWGPSWMGPISDEHIYVTINPEHCPQGGCSAVTTSHRLEKSFGLWGAVRFVQLPALVVTYLVVNWYTFPFCFATNLPNSDGFTCKLIPLKNLPTAFQTAELLFLHVFLYYGILENVVSDRGPRFISRVWRVLFGHLGVTMSLSSRYHPQSNGEVKDSYCHQNQHRWRYFLPGAENAQNCVCARACMHVCVVI